MGSELQTYSRNQKLQLWSERVKACRESGMTVAEWCAANNVNKFTYYDWQRRVFESAKEASGQTQFVELKERSAASGVVAVIHRRGYDIEITSMEALERLLEC
jgi:hypothetical protein